MQRAAVLARRDPRLLCMGRRFRLGNFLPRVPAVSSPPASMLSCSPTVPGCVATRSLPFHNPFIRTGLIKGLRVKPWELMGARPPSVEDGGYGRPVGSPLLWILWVPWGRRSSSAGLAYHAWFAGS